MKKDLFYTLLFVVFIVFLPNLSEPSPYYSYFNMVSAGDGGGDGGGGGDGSDGAASASSACSTDAGASSCAGASDAGDAGDAGDGGSSGADGFFGGADSTATGSGPMGGEVSGVGAPSPGGSGSIPDYYDYYYYGSYDPGPVCVSGYGTSCVRVNACGGSSAPGVVQCDGSCSEVAPPLPSFYGRACRSEANTCGMTSGGYLNCVGACNASRPSDALCVTCGNGVCEALTENSNNCSADCGEATTIIVAEESCTINGACDGTETASSCPADCASVPVTIVAGGAGGDGNFSATPNPVIYGRSTRLEWNISGATSCYIEGKTADDGTFFQRIPTSGTTESNGLTQSLPLIEAIDYTLFCSGAGGSDSDTIRVNVRDLRFGEF